SVAIYPGFFPAQAMRVFGHLNAGREDAAEAAARSAMPLTDGRTPWHEATCRFALAEGHRRRGEFESAAEHFRASIAMKENWVARVLLGQTYLSLGRTDDAAREFAAADRLRRAAGPEPNVRRPAVP
ncbi:MAG: tetratricopeptide repeat protein, partial [Fimbriiglobus sp.]